MELIIKGKNMEVTDRLHDYVHKKIGKLDRYLPTISEAWVELSVEGARAAQHRQVCQVTLRSNGTILRAEERSDDIFSSIDKVLAKMYRQIARYKGKRQNRWRGVGTAVEPVPLDLEDDELEGKAAELMQNPTLLNTIKMDDGVKRAINNALKSLER